MREISFPLMPRRDKEGERAFRTAYQHKSGLHVIDLVVNLSYRHLKRPAAICDSLVLRLTVRAG